MRNKVSLVVLAVLFVCTACENVADKLPLREVKNTKIEKEKEWFKGAYPAGVSTCALLEKDSEAVPLRASWQNAMIVEAEGSEIIEVPVSGPQRYTYMNEESRKLYNETLDDIYIQNESRLLIKTNPFTGVKEACIVTYCPDYSFLQETDFNPFKKLQFSTIEKNFSGMVIYQEVNGDFMEGWIYKAGKKENSINFGTNRFTESGLKSSQENSNCWIELIYETFYDCVEIVIPGVYDPVTNETEDIIDYDCREYTMVVGQVEICGPPDQSTTLQKFYNMVLNNSLTTSQREQFERDLLEVLSLPVYDYMFLYILNTHPNYFIIVDIEEKYPDSRGYFYPPIYEYYELHTGMLFLREKDDSYQTYLKFAIVQMYQECMYKWAYTEWRNPGLLKEGGRLFEGMFITDLLDSRYTGNPNYPKITICNDYINVLYYHLYEWMIHLYRNGGPLVWNELFEDFYHEDYYYFAMNIHYFSYETYCWFGTYQSDFPPELFCYKYNWNFYFPALSYIVSRMD